ncbi:helix-turn-helix domain-containing protein [Listeria seeligeri]|uniref:Helix-turn-helix domain-containing protein n=1 Tax=Listeria immobilis TaxID=2713502 RepID=A0ABR6SVF7_9LIST|nr:MULTISPECIES: helix-turn-helix domain-containing protein [Listeria]MBC1509445.1 helix-turn-helix domain-containing protein [Listeria immobilis]MBC1532096.1 helix-turn-helix domain-containing protein [Listeria seeligeri]MBC1827090.1 helix-turn-helix domain-containing protein [Listeria seeligeri]MBC1840116.1 helix-turn-helix domain-containing protein [Listeria seeligeri]MBC6141877.1 helix-turn-helix domain-containing protein [Listeria seeligeri]
MKEKRLVQFRKELSMNQKEFAKTLGVSRSLLAKIETGNRMPSYRFMKAIKKSFPEANIDDLFFK